MNRKGAILLFIPHPFRTLATDHCIDLYCGQPLCGGKITIPVPGASPMRAAGYCSHCGEQIKKRSTRLFFVPMCAECTRLGRRDHYLRLASVILCAAIIFVVGQLTAPRKSLQFIGTPVDLNSIRNRPSAEQTNNHNATAIDGQEASGQAHAVDTICGAPTKSGRPCRRKVKSGGYCWQHRERSGPKAKAANAQDR